VVWATRTRIAAGGAPLPAFRSGTGAEGVDRSDGLAVCFDLVVGDEPYRILGVSRDATAHELRRAFRKAVLKYHPDVHDGSPDEGARLLHQARQAYQTILEDMHRRKHRPLHEERRAHIPPPWPAGASERPPRRSWRAAVLRRLDALAWWMFAFPWLVALTAGLVMIAAAIILPQPASDPPPAGPPAGVEEPDPLGALFGLSLAIGALGLVLHLFVALARRCGPERRYRA